MAKRSEIEEKLLLCRGVKKEYQEAWDADKFMIGEKMFAFIGEDKIGTPILTIKMQPQEGAYYRENYPFITEGYYMNKIHWISLAYESIKLPLLSEVIEKSYTNFVSTLPKKMQIQLD